MPPRITPLSNAAGRLLRAGLTALLLLILLTPALPNITARAAPAQPAGPPPLAPDNEVAWGLLPIAVNEYWNGSQGHCPYANCAEPYSFVRDPTELPPFFSTDGGTTWERNVCPDPYNDNICQGPYGGAGENYGRAFALVGGDAKPNYGSQDPRGFVHLDYRYSGLEDGAGDWYYLLDDNTWVGPADPTGNPDSMRTVVAQGGYCKTPLPSAVYEPPPAHIEDWAYCWDTPSPDNCFNYPRGNRPAPYDVLEFLSGADGAQLAYYMYDQGNYLNGRYAPGQRIVVGVYNGVTGSQWTGSLGSDDAAVLVGYAGVIIVGYGSDFQPPCPCAPFDLPCFQGCITGAANTVYGLVAPNGDLTLDPTLLLPGNQAPYTPHTPIPGDGATSVPLTQTLSWQGGDRDCGGISYTVAFGPADPPPIVATDVMTTSYDPGPLLSGTTYYWAITATDGLSTSAGPTWHFSTADEPIAGLAATNDSPTPLGQPTTLTATIAAGTNVSYTWSFGDGTFGAGAVLSHTYTALGAYAPVVTASNSVSQLTTTTAVTITIPCEPVHDAAFAWTPPTPTAGLPVTFTAGASGTLPITFTWDLGDGSLAAGQVVGHSYAQTGTYVVLLTATNDCGFETVTHTIVVEAPCIPIEQVDFAWTPLHPVPSETVTFVAATGNDLDRWQIEIVDSPISQAWGSDISLAMDASGRLHAAYADPNDSFKYAYHDGAGWTIETIESGPIGIDSDLTLDAAGRPHVAYFHYYTSPDLLRYAYFDGTTWQIETVDSGNIVSEYASLALDSAERPHIVYKHHGLQHAWHDGSNWITETVFMGTNGTGLSLVMDAADLLHISFIHGGSPGNPAQLAYAYHDGSTWISQTVGGASGGETSLALDSAGHPHISYGYWGDRRYARFDGTSWFTETIDDRPYSDFYTSLVLDQQDHPHISYGYVTPGGDSALRYTWHNGSNWQIETIEDQGQVGSRNALVLDAWGNAHIAYYQGLDDQVRYARQIPLPSQPISFTWDLGDGSQANGQFPSHSYTQVGIYAIVLTATNCGTATAIAVHTLTVVPCTPIEQVDFGWTPLHPVPSETVTFVAASGNDLDRWQIEIVDSPISQGWANDISLAMDASDQAHVAYTDHNDRLEYAFRDGSGWIIETVEVGPIGGDSELVLDTADQPHIAYFRDGEIPQSLRYAHYDGTTWQIETIDTGDSLTEYVALALNSLDYPHIVYRDQALIHAWYDGTTWFTETVLAGASGQNLSLVLDSNDLPHISFNNLAGTPGPLMYAYHDGTTWISETVAHSRGGETSLALDTAGHPHISYGYWDWGDRRYARFDGTSWFTETIDDRPYSDSYTSLVLDQQDRPHISYGYVTPGGDTALRYAWHNGSNWQIETIEDQGTVGSRNALVLDAADNAHIAYYQGLDDQVRYARQIPLPSQPISFTWDLGDGSLAAGRVVSHSYAATGPYTVTLTATNCGTATVTAVHRLQVLPPLPCQPVLTADFNWEPPIPLVNESTHLTATSWASRTGQLSETIDADGGSHLSLVRDAAGQPHVSYVGAGGLLYAYRDGSTWITQTVDASVGYDWGGATSLALDVLGRPHISYYHDTAMSLKYAWHDGSSWQIETVESGEVGYWNALALDPAGRPHISYQDMLMGDLKYAYHDGNGWQLEIVGDGMNAGYFTAIALDSTGRPHISYFSADASALRYAYQDSSGWHLQILSTRSAHSIAIVMDSLDRPHISSILYGDGPTELAYLYHDGSGWQSKRVDQSDDFSKYTDIALDRFGRPHLTYALMHCEGQVCSVDEVRYAFQDGEHWHIESLSPAGQYSRLVLDDQERPQLAYRDATDDALRYIRLGRPPSPPITYTWNLGDGGLATGTVISHSYAATGTYTVLLTATNCGTSLATATHTLTVTLCDPVHAADFGWTPLNPMAQQKIVFHGSASGTLPISYSWDLGDGITATGAVVSHTYLGPGDYAVALTALNCAPTPTTVVHTITVQPCTPIIQVDFDWTPLSPTTSQTVTLSAAVWPTVSGWISTTVQSSGQVGRHNSIALDSADRPHVSYYNELAGNLLYGFYDGASWSVETVDSSGDVGQYSSIALDVGGRPHIAYYDNTHGDLLYAHYDGSTWLTETVTSTGDVGQYSSIDLDSAGRPHIAYFDDDNTDVKYTYYDGSDWQFLTASTYGAYPALALDSTGLPGISYYEPWPFTRLRYAYYNGSSWQQQVVDNSFNIGRGTSIQFDSFDQPHIAYRFPPEILRYAYRDGGGWHLRTVDPAASWSYYPSLALDVADQAHISYYNEDTMDLRYIHLEGSGWISLTVDSSGDVGAFNSLALDRAGFPHISYYDATAADLRYARYRGVPTPPLSFIWDLGDGSLATGQVVDHSYSQAGSYVVLLTATNNCGFEAVTHTIVVEPPCEPVHDTAFVWTPTTPTAGLPVTFTAGASGTLPLSFTWDLGDGSLAAGQVVGHSYSQAGSYIVILSATNNCGFEAVTHTIVVEPPCDPVHDAAFAWTPTTPTAGLPVTFTAGASGTLPLSFTWDLGDGSLAAGQVVGHSYSQAGSYIVILSATNDCGFETVTHTIVVEPPCEPVHDAAFAWSPTTLTAGLPVTFTAVASGTPPLSFTWDLGDGSLAAGQVVGHCYSQAGSYTVTLSATNGCGFETVTHTIVVEPPCEPVHDTAFVWTPTTPTAGLPVTFTADASGTLPLSFTWDLGDGSLATGQVVGHSYSQAGSYMVTLSATNDCGFETVTHTIVVEPSCEPVHDTAFVWTPTTPTAGLPVTFTAGASGTLPLSFTWDLGDGSLATGQVVGHSYSQAGSYIVTLSATNGCGFETVTHTIVVESPCDPVHNAAFAWSPTTPTAGLPVTFTAGASGTLPLSFTWDLGDGSLAAGQVVGHSYAQAGSYVVLLTASNDCGQAVVTGTITVAGLPCTPVEIVDVATDVVGCQVSLSATLEGDPPFVYLWSFGDGTTSTAETPVHIYEGSASYTITLEARNCEGAGLDRHAFEVSVDCAGPHKIYLPLVCKSYTP